MNNIDVNKMKSIIKNHFNNLSIKEIEESIKIADYDSYKNIKEPIFTDSEIVNFQKIQLIIHYKQSNLEI